MLSALFQDWANQYRNRERPGKLVRAAQTALAIAAVLTTAWVAMRATHANPAATHALGLLVPIAALGMSVLLLLAGPKSQRLGNHGLSTPLAVLLAVVGVALLWAGFAGPSLLWIAMGVVIEALGLVATISRFRESLDRAHDARL